MKNKEKLLFKNLCKFKSKDFDETLLEYASPTVLGYLFFNRMQAVAYGILKEKGLLKNVNREFRNSLKVAYEQNLEKNRSFFWCVRHVTEILSKCSCTYAMLKGAFLCGYYPEGYRTSNDIDLLVLPKDLTEIDNALTKAGFLQGHIRNEEFVKASRKEIIESRMTRGETVPYIKEINMPGMKYLEVDINFSMDYKSGDMQVLEEILNCTHTREVFGLKVRTLDYDNFFIHLCGHLYKEATTLPWVEMKRDMTLYKYCDIYMLLLDIDDKGIEKIFGRAKTLGMEKICAFVVEQVAVLFDLDNKYAVSLAKDVLLDTPEFVNTVISPKDNKLFIYIEKDINKRFFSENRTKLLKEATV